MTQFRKTTKPKRWSWLGISCINALMVSLFVFSGIQNASAGPSFKPVEVRFTINSEPACLVTDANTGLESISVNFGTSLPMSQIDGAQHEKPIPYKITCTNPISQRLMKIRFMGNTANFGNGLLATGQPNLAIEIRQDGTALPIGTNLSFDPLFSGAGEQVASVPPLTAVPVRKPGGFSLTEGQFIANATLLLEHN